MTDTQKINDFSFSTKLDDTIYIFEANRSVIKTVQTCIQNFTIKNKGIQIPIDQTIDYICYGLLKTKQPNIDLKKSREIRTLASNNDNFGDKFNQLLQIYYSKCEIKGNRESEIDFLLEIDREEIQIENLEY